MTPLAFSMENQEVVFLGALLTISTPPVAFSWVGQRPTRVQQLAVGFSSLLVQQTEDRCGPQLVTTLQTVLGQGLEISQLLYIPVSKPAQVLYFSSSLVYFSTDKLWMLVNVVSPDYMRRKGKMFMEHSTLSWTSPLHSLNSVTTDQINYVMFSSHETWKHLMNIWHK